MVPLTHALLENRGEAGPALPDLPGAEPTQERVGGNPPPRQDAAKYPAGPRITDGEFREAKKLAPVDDKGRRVA